MIDYYLIITPFLAIYSLIVLILLKNTLRDASKLIKQRQKQHNKHNNPQKQSSFTSFSFTSTYKQLILNFTLLQYCSGRRANLKLPVIVSISLVSILSFFINSMFMFSWIGSVVCVFFLITSLFSYGRTSVVQHQQPSRIQRQKNFNIMLGIISVLVNIVMIQQTYKNYHNILLTQFMYDVLFNTLLDNIACRPIFFLFCSIPLHRSSAFQTWIQQSLEDINILENAKNEVIDKPGKIYSPTKFNKRIPNSLDINDAKQNLGLDMLRKIKKESQIQKISTTPLKQINQNRQYSMNSFLQTQKKKQEQIIQISDPFQQPQPVTLKNKAQSDSIPMVISNANEQVIEDIDAQIFTKQNSKTTQGPLVDFKKVQNSSIDDQPLKISLASSARPSARQEPLKIYIGGQVRQLQGTFQEQNEQQGRSYQTLQTNGQQNLKNVGFLQVKQRKQQEDQIQEIDLNSPQRRRRNGIPQIIIQESRFDAVKKSKKKKLSIDSRMNPRVIKFTTGQPYLQYLPNMLKQKSKKALTSSRKQKVIESRLDKNIKKKGRTDNIQNILPTFVQDL